MGQKIGIRVFLSHFLLIFAVVFWEKWDKNPPLSNICPILAPSKARMTLADISVMGQKTIITLFLSHFSALNSRSEAGDAALSGTKITGSVFFVPFY
jgi:hypothetical protein